MSAVSIAVRAFRKLEPEDFQLLEAIEQQMRNYEYAPKDAIQNQSELSFSEIDYRLPNLTKSGCWRAGEENTSVIVSQQQDMTP